MTARLPPHSAGLSRRTVWSSLAAGAVLGIGVRTGLVAAQEATSETATDVAAISDTVGTLFSLVRDRLLAPPA